MENHQTVRMIKKFIDKVFNKNAKASAKAKIVSAKDCGINPELVSPNAVRVCQTLQEAGFLAFVVGGAVRDLLLGVPPKDFDVATNATPEQVQRLFRRARIIGRRFQIVHVMMGRETLEVTTFRGASQDAAPKDEHGRVLNDNTFGNQQTDAERRDFTVNAFYYDPTAQQVHDYCGGLKDLQNKTLRVIGEPATRFREDPVRMLRVVRFAAKLGFSVEKKTHAAIAPLADLITNVPPARLFDEIQKLLLSGHAVATIKRLRGEGLHHGLLPLLDVVLEQPLGEKFVMAALANTDDRVRQGKPVTPSFLFAALLWHEVLVKAKDYEAKGAHVYPALNDAMTDVLDTQCESLAIPRRYTADMREIWNLQPRFDKRGRGAYKLVEHPRFRAGYDFYLLRAQSGEALPEAGDWWTQFYEADPPGRDALIQSLATVRPQAGASPGGGGAKRRRRSRGKSGGGGAAPPEVAPPQS
jgi:poly(A) polymerase